MDVTKYRNLYFIGIKGSGMCALALLLRRMGYNIIGSDVEESFYTDDILRKESIEYYEGFSNQNIRRNIHKIDAIVHSTSYNAVNNVEMEEVAKTFQCISYPEALGSISRYIQSCAVMGTHGKSTTTAFIGVLVQALELPLMVLTGAKVTDWDNNTIHFGGNKGLIAEVCEYKNHFVHFYANYAVLTSVELDHPDFFETIDDTIEIFRNFLYSVDTPKRIIACGDTPEMKSVIDVYLKNNCVFYGENEDNDVRITSYKCSKMKQRFMVQGISPIADEIKWEIPVPGKAMVLNVVAALTYIREWAEQEEVEVDWKKAHKVLKDFGGVSRRCEVLYQDDKYVVLDDYGHHPTAIKMTLEGIKEMYKPKRLIVDFMSHTYTRTNVLIDDFVNAFNDADILILNEIYSSARETLDVNKSEEADIMTSEKFYEIMQKHHAHVEFMPNFDDVVRKLDGILQEGDVFVTMGAGDNFRISQRFASILRAKSKKESSE